MAVGFEDRRREKGQGGAAAKGQDRKGGAEEGDEAELDDELLVVVDSARIATAAVLLHDLFLSPLMHPPHARLRTQVLLRPRPCRCIARSVGVRGDRGKGCCWLLACATNMLAACRGLCPLVPAALLHPTLALTSLDAPSSPSVAVSCSAAPPPPCFFLGA